MRHRFAHAVRVLISTIPGIACLAGLLTALPAAAQVAGTDCGCALTGAYVDPDPGVRVPPATATETTVGASPHGRYQVVITSPGLPATLDVVRVDVAGVTTILRGLQGNQWGFSPDDDRFAIGFSVTGPTGTQFEYQLYDLAGGNPAPLIWRNGPTPWSSARLRFSDDGAVFLFAGHDSNGTSLTLVDVASGTDFDTSFLASSPPGDIDADADPSVADWGFGPDPTRFLYTYTLDSQNGNVEWGRVNLLATPQFHEDDSTANSQYAKFSPCGDAIAFAVKQLAASDLTDVYLYSTRSPLAAQLGSQLLPFPELEVQATAQTHEVLQQGETTFLAANHAGDACPANAPPVADFDAPPGLVAGTPGDFTDASTDADGQVVAWSWDFGDGSGSSATDPSHAYAASGSYTVRLTVTDDDGATDFVEKDVSVCGALGTLTGRLLVQDGSLDSDLEVLNVDDGSRVRITNNAGSVSFSEVAEARFSPDATQIAYADEGNFLAGIWVMDADGSHRRRLTDGSGSTHDFDFHHDPAWSPDGQWIAYVDSDVTAPADRGLWIMRADGSARAKIPNTAFLDFSPNFAPEISPACAGLPAAQRSAGCYTLLFARNVSGVVRLAEIGGDGSGFAFVTAPGFSYGTPRLSPDGEEIAFTRFLGLFGPLGGVTRIFTIPRAGGAEQQVTQGGDDNFRWPVWSPDGGALAYAYSVNGIPGSITDLDVAVSDPAGCNSRILHSAAGLQSPLDWAPGRAVQGLGSIEGFVRLDASYLTTIAGAVVEISGDVQATTTADANGHFLFENIPIGANVTIRLVSAPGYTAFGILPPSFVGFVGHAVAVEVTVTADSASIHGTVRTDDGFALEGVTLTAVGPNGSTDVVSDADGEYSLSLLKFEDYTLTPSLAGYSFDPPSFALQDFTGWFVPIDFTAIPDPPVTPPGRIAFVRDENGVGGEIYAVDLDGANEINLTSDPADDRDPAWSPDGARIAFTSIRGGNWQLYVMDADGSDVTPLGVAGREPAWSPDGLEIVYASEAGLQIYRIGDGSVTPLTADSYDASPRFRGDGFGLVTFERYDGVDIDLFQASLAQGEFFFDVLNTALPDTDPAWWAGGNRIAYASGFGYPVNAPGIWTVDLDTSDRTAIATGANPTWSPDGQWVAFDDGQGAIQYKAWNDPAGAPIAVVASGTDSDPDWQPSADAACANAADDDGDGLVDLDDPGCANAGDASEQTNAPGCDNGLDDDGDGLTDMEDPGCPFPVQPYENPICDNGLDDDGDGATDADDPTCQAHWPYWEEVPSCGLGAELALLLGAMRWRKFTLGVRPRT